MHTDLGRHPLDGDDTNDSLRTRADVITAAAAARAAKTSPLGPKQPRNNKKKKGPAPMPPERSMTARVRGGKLDPQHDRCIHYILSCIHSFIHSFIHTVPTINRCRFIPKMCISLRVAQVMRRFVKETHFRTLIPKQFVCTDLLCVGLHVTTYCG